ncbi:MAG: hypothetical protein ACP5QO_12905 [Clostridia bacterium]
MSNDPSLGELLRAGGLPEEPPIRALLEFARHLTVHVGDDHGGHVTRLLASGYSVAAVQDAAQVVAYFNYVNRLALGLGVELEARWDLGDRGGLVP